MKHVSQKSDLPTSEHLAVLIFSQRYVEGDERSRTHPGHGYPASYENEVKYVAFKSHEELTEWVSKNERASFAVINAVPKTIQTKLSVSLS
jgi:hypothetical protein